MKVIVMMVIGVMVSGEVMGHGGEYYQRVVGGKGGVAGGGVVGSKKMEVEKLEKRYHI